MNYNHMLANFKFDRESLLNFGFAPTDGDTLSYRVDLPNSLYVVVRISPKKLDVDVFDAIFNDKYQPFVSGHGGGAIKSEVREILENILAQCSSRVDARKQTIDYMKKRFGTDPEFPWEDMPEYCTFKTATTKKWYAIIMKIPAKTLGLEGDDPVDIVNLKLQPARITQMVDGVRYFPAYHMNKKHWVTVLLNAHTDFAALEQLIIFSYALAARKW